MIIPIKRPDKMNSLGQQNVLGVMTGVSDDVYTIGTKYGSLGSSYTRNQFYLCTSNRFLHPSHIPKVTVSQTNVMRNSSLSLEEGSFPQNDGGVGKNTNLMKFLIHQV